MNAPVKGESTANAPDTARTVAINARKSWPFTVRISKPSSPYPLRINKYCQSHIHDVILRNPFYLGYFIWDREQHKGSHPGIISPALFQRVRDILDGHNKPKYHKHEFAFGGLLTCAYDDCMVTAEFIWAKSSRAFIFPMTGWRRSKKS